MYLIGDIGNTDIKICLLNRSKKRIKKIILKTEKRDYNNLKKNLDSFNIKFNSLKKILFCSVVPECFTFIKKYFKLKTKIKCVELKELNISKLLKINVNKKQIGSDRIANSISVINNKDNYIIIDFGTATTFDVILKNKYIGGLIAPGVELSLINLSKKASLIPKIKFTKMNKIIGKNTEESVRSGFYWGYVGLINNIVNLIKKDAKSHFNVILTGGLAHLFKNDISSKIIVNKELTLEGLIKLI